MVGFGDEYSSGSDRATAAVVIDCAFEEEDSVSFFTAGNLSDYAGDGELPAEFVCGFEEEGEFLDDGG